VNRHSGVKNMTRPHFLWLMLIVGAVFADAQPAGVRAAMWPEAARKLGPKFRLENRSGKKVTLAKFRGRVVLLNFWATECGGCKEELPYFIEFDRTMPSKQFEVVGISMDIPYEELKSAKEAWALVNPFVQRQKIEYPILMADDAVMKAYDITALPATYLIDKKGRVAAVYRGKLDKGDVEANLRTLLKER
jgi:peroxiredoxin